jgi:hypothetical protein
MELTSDTLVTLGSAGAVFVGNWAVIKHIVASHEKVLDQHRESLAAIYARLNSLESSRVHPDDHDELARKVAAIDTAVQLSAQAQRSAAHDVREMKSMLIGLLSAAGGPNAAAFLKSLMPNDDYK